MDLTGASDADAVAEVEHHDHHHKLVRQPSASVSGGWIERVQLSFRLKIVDRIRYEPFESIIFDSVLGRLRYSTVDSSKRDYSLHR